MRILIRILLWPFRLLRLLSKNLLILLFVAAMALNLAVLTSTAMFSAVSGVLASAGLGTVQARQSSAARKLTAANGRLVAANDRLVGSNGRLLAANNRLADSNAKLKVAGEKLGAANAKMIESANRARSSVATTVRGVSRRITMGAARNIAAMAGEAVPGFGVGVIVASTVWEIYDACETLADLHALEKSVSPGSADPEDRDRVCAMQVPTMGELKRKVLPVRATTAQD